MTQSNAGHSAAKPAQKCVAIKDLPIYPEREQHPSSIAALSSGEYRYVEDDTLPLQKQCRALRLQAVEQYIAFAEKFKPIDKFFTSISNGITNAENYLRSDETAIIPKAAAITVGGMTGVLLSLRRYGTLRKIFYPVVGLGVMTAFCYPNETIDVVQIGVAHAQRTWEDFQKSPETPKK